MHSDPTAYILATAIISGALGFFGCALFAAQRIREERRESYWEGYGACNRAHHPEIRDDSDPQTTEGIYL